MSTSAKLIFSAAKWRQKSSRSRKDLAQRENAVLLVQDDFLDYLFFGDITDISGYSFVEGHLRRATSLAITETDQFCRGRKVYYAHH